MKFPSEISMRNPFASAACCLTALLLASSLNNVVDCSRFDRFKNWTATLPGADRFSKSQTSVSDSSQGSSRSLSSYLPSFSFGGKSSSNPEHDSEGISSLVNSLSSNFPTAKMAVMPGYKELSSKNVYYYGQVDSDGERHGNGLLYDKESGCIYIGGWCNDCRNGLGVSFTPKETSTKAESAKYTVGMHRWRMGFVQEHISALSSVGETFVALLRLLEVKGYSLNGLVDLMQVMIQSDSIDYKKGCSPDGFVGVSGVSGANKPYYQEVSLDGIIDPSTASLGAYSSEKTLSNSTIIPFKVSSSQHAVVQLFSFEENYHPTAVLFEVDESSSSSKKKLIGRKLASGHAISYSFSSERKYYLEVGNLTSGSALAGTVASGKFMLMLMDRAAMNEISGRTYTVTTGSFTYKISPTGSFTQKDGAGTRTVGTYSKDIAPFWDTTDTSITFFFINGENCGRTPRMGKLDIAFDNSNDSLVLSDVTENPTCVYKANGRSKYVGELRDAISKAESELQAAAVRKNDGFSAHQETGGHGHHQQFY